VQDFGGLLSQTPFPPSNAGRHDTKIAPAVIYFIRINYLPAEQYF